MSDLPPRDERDSSRFPRAPGQAEWDAMSEEERRRAVDGLPDEVTDAELSPPEGGFHFHAKVEAADTVRRFFGTSDRGLYVEGELPVYYPATRRFAPDLLAVRDVDRHLRHKWVVSVEGKGLDFVIEVHYGGDRKKDAEDNVSFYASLGIPEYFIFDRARLRLQGFRLSSATGRTYQPLLGQHGFLHSEVLGLDLIVMDERLRFSYHGTFLADSVEWISQLEALVGQREREVAEEAERATAERERAAELERRLAEAQAELERLKKR